MEGKATLIVGIIASISTAVSMLPQLIKIIKEKKAEDISLPMIITLLTGLALWIAYGVMRKDLVITLANSFSLLINITLLILSIKYKAERT